MNVYCVRASVCALVFLLAALPAQAAGEYNITDLGTLGGSSSYPGGINDSGQVVGEAYTVGNASYHAFLYSGGVMQDLGTLGGGYSLANGINDSGQVVGWADAAGSAQRAFLYSDGAMIDLNSLLPADSGWTLFYAHAINNLGQILGYGTNPEWQWHAFLLTPVPEPGTLALLALGGFALARRRPARPH